MKFIWPCGSLANVLRGFWYAASFYYLGRHYAVDIAVPWWTPIKSSLAGKVAVRSYDSESGYKVYIDSAIGDGIIIRCCYRHMTGPAKVTIGSSVSQGQIIGYVGSTGNSLGPHLHFDLWTNKIIRDDSIVWKPAAGFYAVDPAIYLGQEAALTTAEVEAVIRRTTTDAAIAQAIGRIAREGLLGLDKGIVGSKKLLDIISKMQAEIRDLQT